ncbi:bL21 family ribosomal protein, partial [Mycoplasma todarodis]
MFAIIKTGGKQILVQKDDTIFIEKVEGKEGDK